MKKTLIALAAAAATSFGVAALADTTTNGPVLMTNSEMDATVAGLAPGWACAQSLCNNVTDDVYPAYVPVGAPEDGTSRPISAGSRGSTNNSSPGNLAYFY